MPASFFHARPRRPPSPTTTKDTLAAREKGRLASPALTNSARKSITRTVALLEKQADQLRKHADELIAATESLKADRQLLESIPGVGARQRP